MNPIHRSRKLQITVVVALVFAVADCSVGQSRPPGERAAGDVLSSFEPTDGDGDKMSFRFRFAPWEDVLREFAQRAGLHLDLIDLPPGTFSYFSDESVPPTEALDVLNGYLLQRGFILIRRDDFLVSINIDSGPHPNLIPFISRDELYARGRNELLTVVYSLQLEELDALASQVTAILGPQGRAIAIEAARALAVTDIGTNLRRVDEMLRGLSALEALGSVVLRVHALEHVPAAEAEQTLRALLGLDVPATEEDTSVDDDLRERTLSQFLRRNSGMLDSRNTRNRGDDESEIPEAVRMAVNARSNELLVAAAPETQNLVAQAVESIDVPLSDSSDNGSPYLHRLSVKGGNVQQLIDWLRALQEEAQPRRIELVPPGSRRKHIEVRQPAEQAGANSGN